MWSFLTAYGVPRCNDLSAITLARLLWDVWAVGFNMTCMFTSNVCNLPVFVTTCTSMPACSDHWCILHQDS